MIGCYTRNSMYTVTVLVIIVAYFAYDKYLEHQEIMAGKRNPND